MTGSLALRELATSGTRQDNNDLVNWLIIYRTVSLSLCVVLTSFIIGRLIIVDRRGGSTLSRPKSPLKNVARMLVESASLETMSTLVYVIAMGLGSPLQNVFLPILGQVQVSTSAPVWTHFSLFFSFVWTYWGSAGDCPDADHVSRRTWPGRDGIRTTQTSQCGRDTAKIVYQDRHRHNFLQYGLRVFGVTVPVKSRRA